MSEPPSSSSDAPGAPWESRSPVTELIYDMMRVLERDEQWHGRFAATDVYGVSAARSAGRAAGRHLGLRVYTSVAEVDGHQLLVSVYGRREV